MKKIQTKVECPNCGTVLDFSHVKQAIKDRLDQELDSILEEL
jgi:6-pyruvoyl-tetrahydropterin synthase